MNGKAQVNDVEYVEASKGKLSVAAAPKNSSHQYILVRIPEFATTVQPFHHANN
jgi:hypothetical protein